MFCKYLNLSSKELKQCWMKLLFNLSVFVFGVAKVG